MFTFQRFSHIGAILALLLVTALLQNTPIPPTQAQQGMVWEWHNPLPQGNNLEDVWGSAPDNVYAVGRGALLHYDGQEWSILDDEETYYGVWGSSASDVFVVGDGGIHHYDGHQWTTMEAIHHPQGVWGFGSHDVFAVGGIDGYLIHYDGNAWTELDCDSNNAYYALWGSSASDLYIAGEDGLIRHWDGQACTTVYYDRDRNLWAIWGAGPDDIFVGGDSGVIIHFDGHSWSKQDLGTADFNDIWGFSGNDVYAASEGDRAGTGSVMHYDGRQWSRVYETPLILKGIWGQASSELFAVGNGGRIYHAIGGAWTEMSHSVTNYGLDTVWGAAADDVFAGGGAGTMLHYDGRSWQPMDCGTDKNINAIWGLSGQDVYAVTHAPYHTESSILHYDGSAWQVTDSGVQRSLNGIWGSGPADIFAVGDYGVILHYDGSSWSQMQSGVGDAYLFDVWGTASDNVYAVGATKHGYDGIIVHYDGHTWASVDIGDWDAGPSGAAGPTTSTRPATECFITTAQLGAQPRGFLAGILFGTYRGPAARMSIFWTSMPNRSVITTAPAGRSSTLTSTTLCSTPSGMVPPTISLPWDTMVLSSTMASHPHPPPQQPLLLRPLSPPPLRPLPPLQQHLLLRLSSSTYPSSWTTESLHRRLPCFRTNSPSVSAPSLPYCWR